MNWLSGGFGCLGSLFPFVMVPLLPVQAQTTPIAPPTQSVPAASQEPESSPACFSAHADLDGLESSCLEGEEAMAQVRSLSELSDIRPTDWAFQALQALIERYGILAGYPDGTFRGNRLLSRYEFAAALRRVLEVVEEQLYGGETAKLREDYLVLKQLLESYGDLLYSTNPERLGLANRINALDTQVRNLERQQFSTTTKLNGQTVTVFTDGSRAQMTVVNRTRLNLRTSFTGQDLLLTQLETGNNGGDAASRAQSSPVNLLGSNGLLAGGGGLDYVEVDSNVRLSKLYYTFQPVANLSLTIGSRLTPRDFIDDNRFANSSDQNFASSFFMNNPLIVQNSIDRNAGAGAVLTWKPSPALRLTALYAAADAANPTKSLTEGGLFGDRYQGSLEAEYALNRDFVTRLQFTRAKIDGIDIYAGGVNVEWAWNQQFALFGRYGIGNYRGFSATLQRDLDLTPQSWAIGTIIRNIVIPDSSAGLAIGQPFVASALGRGTQTNIEGFYSFLFNEHISFTPGFMIISSPNNNPSKGTIWEFFVRLVFMF